MCCSLQAPLPQHKPKGTAAAKDKPVSTAAADAPKRVTRSQSRATAQGPTSAQQGSGAAAASRRGSLQASRQKQPQQRSHTQQQQQDRQQPQDQQQLVQEQQQQRLVLPPLPDIDVPDKQNPLAECQYVNDIYSYFRHIEPKFRARADYMDSQVGHQQLAAAAGVLTQQLHGACRCAQ